MKKVIHTWQPQIQSEIRSILEEFSNNTQFQLDTKLIEYAILLSQKGKQFRGCLLAEFYSLQKSQLSDVEKRDIARLAAAIELHGTAILIHDDIIDKSMKRRGEDTAQIMAQKIALAHNLKEPIHFGISTAICLADFLFFVADHTVAQLDFSSDLKTKIAAINGKELALLGLAEIEDLRLSSSDDPVSKTDIINMFAGKTGRYTGRWPLELAAVTAELHEDVIQQLGAVGEKIGILYQLKDDQLGLFGDEMVTGKSTSSDITEGKKTLYYWYLSQLSDSEKDRVFAVMGNADASREDISWLKSYIEEKGIKQKVTEVMVTCTTALTQEIKNLPLTTESLSFLLEIVDFVVNRDK